MARHALKAPCNPGLEATMISLNPIDTVAGWEPDFVSVGERTTEQENRKY